MRLTKRLFIFYEYENETTTEEIFMEIKITITASPLIHTNPLSKIQ